jgi:hypothetical protein
LIVESQAERLFGKGENRSHRPRSLTTAEHGVRGESHALALPVELHFTILKHLGVGWNLLVNLKLDS